jgi:hypothetical protein
MWCLYDLYKPSSSSSVFDNSVKATVQPMFAMQQLRRELLEPAQRQHRAELAV